MTIETIIENQYDYRFNKSDSKEQKEPEYLHASYSLRKGSQLYNQGYRFQAMVLDVTNNKTVGRIFHADRNELYKEIEQYQSKKLGEWKKAYSTHLEKLENKNYSKSEN